MTLQMSDQIRGNPTSPQYSYTVCFQGSATSPLEQTAAGNTPGTWIQGREHPQQENSIRILLGGVDLALHLPFSPEVFDEIRAVHNLPRDPLQCPNGSFFIKYVLNSGKVAIILYVKYAQVYLTMEYDPNHNVTATVVRLSNATTIGVLAGRLASLRCVAWHPLLLPTVLIEHMVNQLPGAVAGHSSRILTTRRSPLKLLSITKRRAQECSQILKSLQELPTSPVSPDTPRAVVAGTYCVDSKLSHLAFSIQNILDQCDMHASINNEDLQSATQRLTQSADYNARVMTVLTVIYLPLSAVAAIFSTSFFDVKQEGGLTVSSDFWIFWATAVGLSLATMVLLVKPHEWYGIYRRAKGVLSFCIHCWFKR
ncbi:hypothetical protein BDV32DRAFT_144687 [Aspergillus pseudonomiae]|nr:hypothetical protein BDV32DRAFT_144687 [Aspergillus pseudonomiae]